MQSLTTTSGDRARRSALRYLMQYIGKEGLVYSILNFWSLV